jgi:hypothetical protein
MALTITNQGAAQATTAGTALAITANTGAVGDMMVVVISADNSGSLGAATISSVTDGTNTYTLRGSVILNDPGAAGAGCQLAFFTSVLTGALSNSTITVNFDASTGRRLAHVYRVQPGAGETPVFRAAGAGSTGLDTGPTITATSVAGGDTIFGAMAAETDDTITTDSDTTNGNWSTAFTALQDDGADGAAMTIHSQWKTVSGTGNQTYNLGIAGAQDYAINWITVYPGHALLANDVSSASSVTTPAVAQTHSLLANDVASASSVTTPALTQVHVLNAADVASASSVSNPALAEVNVLTADDVSSASSVTTPALGQIHALLAADVASASTVTTPTVGQIHALLADDVASASNVTAPVLGQAHVLTADDVVSASSVTTPTLAEVAAGTDVLLADDVSAASSVSTPTLGQIHALLANSVISASSVSTPTLAEAGEGGDGVQEWIIQTNRRRNSPHRRI